MLEQSLARLEALPPRLRSMGHVVLLAALGALAAGWFFEPIIAAGALVAPLAIWELRRDAAVLQRHCGAVIENARRLQEPDGAVVHWLVDQASWNGWLDHELARCRGLMWKSTLIAAVPGAVFGVLLARAESLPELAFFITGAAVFVGLIVGAIVRRETRRMYEQMRDVPAPVRVNEGALSCGPITALWFEQVPFQLSVFFPHFFLELDTVRLTGIRSPLLEFRWTHRWWGLRVPITARRLTLPVPRDRLEESRALLRRLRR